MSGSGSYDGHYTRIILRDGKPLRCKPKRCCDCGMAGLASEAPDSDFPPARRRDDGHVVAWSPRCNDCHRAYRRLITKRAAERPEVKRHRCAAQKRYYRRKLSQDPGFFNDYRRITYRLRAEREGRQVRKSTKPARSRRDDARRYPVEPFMAWLRAYMFVAGIELLSALGDELHIEERLLRRMLLEHGQDNVSIDTVDRALVNARYEVEIAGRTIFTLDDLYPLEAT